MSHRDMLSALSAPWRIPDGVQRGLHWVAGHTGVPVLVVAALAIVLSWRIFKHTVRLALEVGAVAALLVLATALGWISW